MQVYKFGGASVKDAAAVKNVIQILSENAFNEKVVVISAMGKTTNELEEVVRLFHQSRDGWKEKLDEILHKHLQIIQELYNGNNTDAETAVIRIIEGVKGFLQQTNSQNYNFIYDQIVSAGEFISTRIVSDYANFKGLNNTLLDARKCIFTDHAYTEGKVDWKKTEMEIIAIVPQLIKEGFVITQGFIGCTPENFTTTLGREGSDYTAAIFSYALQASRMTVWKDVEGILNADPKEFSDAHFIPELSYMEAIEMTYYGASVIHPKTIKPLQNKGIPLEVRSFVHHNKRGSVISTEVTAVELPPIIIVKRQQTLLSFSAKDFSFIAEEHLAKVFDVFAKNRLRINMMQNAAISFSIVVDYKKEKIENIIDELAGEFSVLKNEELLLYTIRHYNEAVTARLLSGKNILLRQITRNTLQALVK